MHVQIKTKERTCESHGMTYTSTLWALPESKAPTLLRQFWSNCPKCNQVFGEYSSNRNPDHSRNERDRIQKEDAGIPARFATSDMASWIHTMDQQRAIWRWVRKYIDNFDQALETGRSVVFLGHTGTGKTHMAIAVLANLLSQGHTGAYTTVMDMLSRFKDTYNQKSKETERAVMEDLTTCAILVIDEVGKQLDTAYESAQLFRVLDRRYCGTLPTLLVSNLDRKGLKEFLGEPIVDRLGDKGGKFLTFDWGSHRGKQ